MGYTGTRKKQCIYFTKKMDMTDRHRAREMGRREGCEFKDHVGLQQYTNSTLAIVSVAVAGSRGWKGEGEPEAERDKRQSKRKSKTMDENENEHEHENT